MNKKFLFILSMMLIIAIFISGCVKKEAPYSQENAAQLAKLVMEGAPMYKFDGFDLKLIKITNLAEEAWQNCNLRSCRWTLGYFK